MTVAYVCLEYALENNLPIYAGGLGALAGDLILETPPENLNMFGFGIFYSHGFHAHYEDGPLNPTRFGLETLKDEMGKTKFFSVELGSEEIWFQVWKKTYNKSTVYLLDTDISINTANNQNITKHLYGDSKAIMLQQQIILAFGIIKVLKSENISPDIYHLNEGHTALTIIALAEGDSKKLEEVKNSCVGTKHTILTGGGLYIDKDTFKTSFQFLEKKGINLDELFETGVNTTHPTSFSTTNFLLRYTKISSAVSIAHAEAEKELHPHSRLVPITNGINKSRWQRQQIELDKLSDQELFAIHQENKASMVDFLEKETGSKLSLNTLTITWARRFASYKRPDLLFKNIDELSKITHLFPSVQFIIAGQTNPNDEEAKDIKDQIQRNLREKPMGGRICFLENYNLEIATKLVSGSDVWLNTPTPKVEASGTSGMKAGINGALAFSTSDGWIKEVNWDDIGWVLAEENIAENLYKILESEIFPLYYSVNDNLLPAEWIKRMRRTISIVEQGYTTERVLKDYQEKLYNI